MLFDWQGAWASVIHHPLFGIGITLGAYQLVLAAFEKTRWIFLQPVLVRSEEHTSELQSR